MDLQLEWLAYGVAWGRRRRRHLTDNIVDVICGDYFHRNKRDVVTVHWLRQRLSFSVMQNQGKLE